VQVLGINLGNDSAQVNIFMRVPSFPSASANTSVTAWVVGDVETFIVCNATSQNRDGSWSLQGNSSTTCFLEGSGQLFPFDSYSMRFELLNPVTFYNINCTLSATNSSAFIAGPEYYSLHNLWTVENATFANSSYSQEINFNLQRSGNSFSTAILEVFMPIIGSYYLLVSTLILDPKRRLNERLTIYLALFVFVPAFLLGIQSYLPYRSSLSIPEFLLTNLVISTTIFGIFSIIGNRLGEHALLNILASKRSKRTRVFIHNNDWDILGVVLALLFFGGVYISTLFRVLIPAPSLLISYLILPAYVIWYPVENFKDTSLNNILTTLKGFILATVITIASFFFALIYPLAILIRATNFFIPVAFIIGGVVAGFLVGIYLNRYIKSFSLVLFSSVFGSMLAGALSGSFGIEGVEGISNGAVIFGIWGIVIFIFEMLGAILGIYFYRARALPRLYLGEEV